MKIRYLFIILFAVAAFGLVSASCSGNKGADTEDPGKVDDGGERGKDIDMTGADQGALRLADPFILFFNKVYYAYGTSDTQPNAGYEAYYSTDMKKWRKYAKLILSKEDSYGTGSFWAPEIYYRESNKTFYLYYSAEEHICVATSGSPLGPFRQTEKVAMMSDKAIDSSLFVDDDGTPYLYYVKFNDGNCIWMCQLEDDWKTLKLSTQKQCFTAGASGTWERRQGKIVEGPSVFKEDGVYYMIYSANHYQSQDYAVGYATATSPFGPWTKASENPILRRPGSLLGTGHGARFQDRNYGWRYVFHAHSNSETVNPRLLHITDMAVTGGKVTMSPTNIVSAREVD